MKIAVLEWLCGGGLTSPPEQTDTPLLAEGWGMLQCLTTQLTDGGYDVIVPIDARLWSHLESYERFPEQPRKSPHFVALTPPIGIANSGEPAACADKLHFEWIAQAWRQCAAACETAIIIAPEIDDILARIIPEIAGSTRLLNCQQDFLHHASDKLQMAQLFAAANIAHPSTTSAKRATNTWLAQASRQASSSRWVAKPRNGAGCDCLYVVEDTDILPTCLQFSDDMILQPWVDGRAFSCSGIADANGHVHWLPLMTQNFLQHAAEAGSALGASPRVSQMKYVGGELAAPDLQEKKPANLMRDAISALGPGAFGWIGVDLTYDEAMDQWTIIEVNPRCTSSIVELSKVYSGNLADAMVRLSLGHQDQVPNLWTATNTA